MTVDHGAQYWEGKDSSFRLCAKERNDDHELRGVDRASSRTRSNLATATRRVTVSTEGERGLRGSLFLSIASQAEHSRSL